jgi:hypothetical protein
VFLVISVYINLRNILPKSGTFLPGHPVYFVDRASRYKFLVITNFTHIFVYLFIYFMSLHVSSVTVFIIRRSNCINTSSGMISLCKGLLGMPVRREEPHTGGASLMFQSTGEYAERLMSRKRICVANNFSMYISRKSFIFQGIACVGKTMRMSRHNVRK